MRSYPCNSPQAAARIVALLLIADGHVSRSEMDALYGRDIERELGPRTCSKSFWSCTSVLPGWAARRSAQPIARAIGKRCNNADRPASHLPEGLE